MHGIFFLHTPCTVLKVCNFTYNGKIKISKHSLLKSNGTLHQSLIGGSGIKPVVKSYFFCSSSWFYSIAVACGKITYSRLDNWFYKAPSSSHTTFLVETGTKICNWCLWVEVIIRRITSLIPQTQTCHLHFENIVPSHNSIIARTNIKLCIVRWLRRIKSLFLSHFLHFAKTTVERRHELYLT